MQSFQNWSLNALDVGENLAWISKAPEGWSKGDTF
jgi:hypothetical protein